MISLPGASALGAQLFVSGFLSFLPLLSLAACGSPPPPVAPPPPPPAPAPEPAPPPTPPAPVVLAAGPLVIVRVTRARTAQVFHVVDALSGWAPGMRRSPYVAWADKAMPLDSAEKDMLAKHAKLRLRRGWGGLDKAFDVDQTIDEAADHAATEKLLSAADANEERMALAHFAPRIDPLIDAQRATLEAFEARLPEELARATPIASRLARFIAMDDPMEIPLALVADPSTTQGGSTFHGGTLVVEVLASPAGTAAPSDEAMTTFFHELFHAVLSKRRETIAIGAGKCDEAIDDETMSEALAYALAPGLLHPPERDLLAEIVARNQARSLRDPLARFERLGFAIRTELGAALEGGHETLRGFLPKACDAWAKAAGGEPKPAAEKPAKRAKPGKKPGRGGKPGGGKK